jgi:hypothetical protein
MRPESRLIQSVIAESGITEGVNHAEKQMARAGFMSASEAIPLYQSCGAVA